MFEMRIMELLREQERCHVKSGCLEISKEFTMNDLRKSLKYPTGDDRCASRALVDILRHAAMLRNLGRLAGLDLPSAETSPASQGAQNHAGSCPDCATGIG
jgi:hypothetical protein